MFTHAVEVIVFDYTSQPFTVVNFIFIYYSHFVFQNIAHSYWLSHKLWIKLQFHLNMAKSPEIQYFLRQELKTKYGVIFLNLVDTSRF